MEPRLSRYLHAKGRQLGLPINGTFELTPRCNFNCKMCYVHLTDEELKQRGKELTAAQWLRIGEEAKQAGVVFLLLTGGEPALRPDFPEIYQGLKAKGFVVTVNSNGLLLEGAIRDLFINDPPSRVNISLYGLSNETYERQCGLPVFDRVVQNIQALRDAGVDVKVSMSVTPANKEDMQPVYEKAKELGVHFQSTPYMFPPIRLHPELCGQNFRVEPVEAGVLMAEREAANSTDEQLRHRFEALKAGQAMPNDAEDDEDCVMTEGEGMRCRGGSTTFWIDWDGKMLPCGQMCQPAEDVLTLGLAEAWLRTHENAAAIRLPAECKVCPIKDICRPCAAMCYCETGRFDGKPEYVCKMRHSYIEHMLELCTERFGGK